MYRMLVSVCFSIASCDCLRCVEFVVIICILLTSACLSLMLVKPLRFLFHLLNGTITLINLSSNIAFFLSSMS